MSKFSDRTIAIPEPVFHQDWIKVSDECEDEERRILQFQKKLINLARKGVSGAMATPERVAWMIFWSRAYAISDSALVAFRSGVDKMAGADLMLMVLQRMSFEMAMQLGIILEPLLSSKLPIAESIDTDTCWTEIKRRFRTYTAWCLWADKCLLEEMLRQRALKEIFNVGRAKAILNNPIQRMMVEDILGADEVYHVAEKSSQVEAQLKDAERNLSRKLNSVNALLKNSSLSEWAHKLEMSYAIGFFELFDEYATSLPKRLRKIDKRFSYYSYLRGSMAIHGSSIDQFLSEKSGKN